MMAEVLDLLDAADHWPALTALDRCDGCGARARARAVLPATPEHPAAGMLLFCGHHLREHGPRLIAEGGCLVVLPDDFAPAGLVQQPSRDEQSLRQ